MNRKLLIPILLAGAVGFSAMGLAACGGGYKDPDKGSLLLHLALDEGSGKTAKDSAGKQGTADVQYVFNDPVY